MIRAVIFGLSVGDSHIHSSRTLPRYSHVSLALQLAKYPLAVSQLTTRILPGSQNIGCYRSSISSRTVQWDRLKRKWVKCKVHLNRRLTKSALDRITQSTTFHSHLAFYPNGNALSAHTGPYDHLSRLFVRVSKYSSNFVAGVYSCRDRKWRSSYLLTPPRPLFCSRVPLRSSVFPASQL